MRGRGGRGTRPLLLAAAPAFLAALVVLPPLAGADGTANPDAGRPAVWRGETGVAGVQVAFDPEPFLPATDIVHVSVPYGVTEWDPSRARASATPLWPGGFVTSFPNLVLPLVVGEEAPPYPGAAQAKHPNQPDDEVGGGLARAHAARDFVESRATYQHPAVPLAQAGVMEIGTITTATSQEWVDGVLVARAETLTTDITILDQIEIDSVRTVAIARSDPSGSADTETATDVAGVTVAGVPAVIDENGISIAGQGDDGAILGAAGAAARDATAFLDELEQDVDIRLVGANEVVEGAEASAQAGGLLISLTFELTSPTGEPLPGDDVVITIANAVFEPFPDDLPKLVPPGPNVIFRKYFGTVAVGTAFARASAPHDAFDFGGVTDLGPLGGGELGSFGGGQGSGPSTLGSGFAGGPDGFTAPVAPATPGDVAAPPPGGPATIDTRGASSFADSFLLTESSADRLALVYGVAALLTVGLFAGARMVRRRLEL